MEKLFALGISAKFIKICRCLYDRATLKIKTNESYSESIDISQGVLQGEILSPLLFALFICDLEDFLYLNNARGLSLDFAHEIVCLAYADDVTMLADSYHDLAIKIKILEKYCEINDLKVNVTKSKIIVFHKGKLKRFLSLYFNGSPLEIVNEYHYLGVVFASSGLFIANLKKATASTCAAIAVTQKIIAASKIDSYYTINRLLRSLCTSVLFYVITVWALRYFEEIDKIQLGFHKNLLSLPRSCPSYAVRLETGSLPLSWYILKNLFKICLNILINHSNDTNTKYNWISQINAITISHGLYESLFILEYKHNILQSDLSRLERTGSLQLYNKLRILNPSYSLLQSKASLKMLKTITQMRLITTCYGRILNNQKMYKFISSHYCDVCHRPESGNMLHFLRRSRCNLFARLLVD